MSRKLLAVAMVAVVLCFGAFWALSAPDAVPASALRPHSPDIANGKAVFFAGGCASCHATPEQDDKTRLGGGLALKSPFGTFYAPNISPDPREGIGRWSEAGFISAMVKGTSPDDRHLYPAFPYTSYQHARFEDLRDLFAYLKTLPAVQNQSKPHDLRFPFNIRRMLGGWKLLFLDGQPFKTDPQKDAVWNRGAYLVNSLAHCGECHSPRNVLGGIVESLRFAGGPDPEGEGWVPNITQLTLKNWSVKDIADLLETGMTPDDKVSGAMAAVVRNTTELSAADRLAIATYIKSLPAVEGPKQREKNK
jgi:mono/diheme cytochrome c family protein